MEQKPQTMNEGTMIGATERAQQQVKEWIRHAEEVRTDARKHEREAKLECKACFYSSRIGGSAIVFRPCMSCGSREGYGSTNTDVLCENCARLGDLCKHCGGDCYMNTRRKQWPVPYSDPTI